MNTEMKDINNPTPLKRNRRKGLTKRKTKKTPPRQRAN